MSEWPTRIVTLVIMAGTMVGVLRAVLARDWRSLVGVVLLSFLAVLVLTNGDAFRGAVLDDLREAEGGGTSAGGESQDDSGLWLPLGLGAGAPVAVFGIVGLWAVIRRRRGRKLRKRAAHAVAQERRAAIEAEHEKVLDAYAAYLCDPLAVLDRPALDDVTTPQTVAVLAAMDVAADARRSGELDIYRPAVSNLKAAWRAADEHARKTGLRHLPPQERATVTRARALLEIALDGAGGEHERHAAYAKARTLLDGILTLPEQAVAAVETKARIPLTTA
ncbi:hypothetical protein ACFWDF_34160 [Streptomyces diastaticus]|uniref:hypothetical protein n=1 Tax=Streptomyces diastaticus TaxID=1956 RepID=UPI00367D73FC